MKNTILSLIVSLVAMPVLAHAADARVYSCVAEMDTLIYWGDTMSNLADAQQSAMQACEPTLQAAGGCELSRCWSSLPDTGDVQPEPIN